MNKFQHSLKIGRQMSKILHDQILSILKLDEIYSNFKYKIKYVDLVGPLGVFQIIY